MKYDFSTLYPEDFVGRGEMERGGQTDTKINISDSIQPVSHRYCPLETAKFLGLCAHVLAKDK